MRGEMNVQFVMPVRHGELEEDGHRSVFGVLDTVPARDELVVIDGEVWTVLGVRHEFQTTQVGSQPVVVPDKVVVRLTETKIAAQVRDQT